MYRIPHRMNVNGKRLKKSFRYFLVAGIKKVPLLFGFWDVYTETARTIFDGAVGGRFF
jgi:hypothetical protein